jgi:hypothetical protein
METLVAALKRLGGGLISRTLLGSLVLYVLVRSVFYCFLFASFDHFHHA